MNQVEGVRWLHCRHDFDAHVAADRLEEGDYYRLAGDQWLGVRYTLSKDASLTVFRQRFLRLLSTLEPIDASR